MNATVPYHVSRARDSFRSAWRFFHAHAGWCTPPGKAACALKLAHAEREASSRGFTFEWSYDPEGCDCCRACEHADHAPVLQCACRNEYGQVRASLGGICGATREYKRVVEAELAAEALAD